MANTKIPVELSSTPGIVDNSNATAITIDSSENVAIGSTIAVGQLSHSGGSVLADFHGSGSGVGSQIAFANDHNTDKFYVGIEGNTTGDGFLYQAKNADINFYTNNSFKAKLDNLGNFGIGTSSPSAKLHVEVADNTEFLRATISGNEDWAFKGASGSGATDYVSFGIAGGTQCMTWQEDGNVGIGTTSPSENLELGDGSSTNRIKIDSSTKAHYIGYDGSDDALQIAAQSFVKFQSGSSFLEAMRIDASGRLLINRTSSASTNGRLDVFRSSGEHCINCEVAGTSNSTLVGFFNANGFVGGINTSGSATSYNTSSDGRLKDVTGKARGLEVINELNPVSYNWKADGKADEGLIAQEVLDIVPNAVSGSEEEMYQMDYSKLVVYLVAGMKEQQTQIEALQSEINELKNS